MSQTPLICTVSQLLAMGKQTHFQSLSKLVISVIDRLFSMLLTVNATAKCNVM